jgi:hypothetical protein
LKDQISPFPFCITLLSGLSDPQVLPDNLNLLFYLSDDISPKQLPFAVGELGKSLTPSKHWIAKIHETGSRSNYDRKAQFCEKG